jgi:mRNA interferase MazF
MTGLDRGDVVLVWFPTSDLVTFKRRPALVVEADNLNTGVPQVVVAMITSNPARRGHPSRVFIPLNSAEAKEAKLRTDSVVMTDNLATILDRAVAAKFGRLKDMGGVDAALRCTLGLWPRTSLPRAFVAKAGNIPCSQRRAPVGWPRRSSSRPLRGRGRLSRT